MEGATEGKSGGAKEQQSSKRPRMNLISGDVFCRSQNDDKFGAEARFVALGLVL